jgi:hypothetical protein
MTKLEYERVPPSAEEFFRMFETCVRDIFRWAPLPMRPLVHLFSADGDMRIVKVEGEAHAMKVIDVALRTPLIAGASFMHQKPHALEGTYYTRESPPRVIRIPIIEMEKDRVLGETIRDATLN